MPRAYIVRVANLHGYFVDLDSNLWQVAARN
jgi:hypothetical protein